MRRKQINWGKRILSATLAAVMSLSLAISPLPGMMADYEGEKVEAEDESTTTEDAIYLPITIRDVRTNDTYLFHGPGTNILSQNKLITVEPQLSKDKTPIYNGEILGILANEIKNNTPPTNSTNVSDLQKALNGQKNEVLKTQTVEVWNNCTSGTTTYNGDFSSIGNCYDAAKWMTETLFADKTFNDKTFAGGDSVPGEGELNTLKDTTGSPITADQLYTFKYTGYEKLMLKYTDSQYKHNGDEISEIKSGHYYFDSMTGIVNSSNNKIQPVPINYDRNNKIIRNDNNGLILNNCGNFFPLGSGRAKDVDATDFEGKANKLNPLSLVGFKETFGTAAESNVNAGFTTAGSGKFVYNKGEDLFFGFRGDDDVYLYINNILVIDMGGTNDKTYGYVELNEEVYDEEWTIPHNPNEQVLNSDDNRVSEEKNNVNSRTAYSTKTLLTDETGSYVTADNKPLTDKTTWAEYLGLKDGGTYDFHFFQMERRSYGSGFDIHTNIRLADPAAVPKKVAYDYTGTELGYGAYVMENSDITYGFQLTNSSDSDSSRITNLEFKDEFGDGDADNVILNKDTISLGEYVKADGTTESRNITDIMYAIYDSASTTTPVYKRYNPENGSAPADWEEEIKNVLKTGIERGKTISLRGFKYNTGKNASFLNTLNTAAVNNMNTTLYGIAKMMINTTSFANNVFVLDYAKPTIVTQADVFHEELDTLNGTNEDTEITSEIETFSLSGDTDLDNIARNSKGYGSLELLKTTYTNNGADNLLKYTPEKVLNGTDMFFIDVNIKTTTPETGDTPTDSTVSKPVTFIPANNVYYEDDFETNESAGTVGISYSGAWSEVTDDVEEAENNNTSDNVGTGDKDANGIPSRKDDVHGWEDALADDSKYSDGSAHTVTGGNATATFTFSGTGVDIYSRTNLSTGLVRAVLYSGGQVTNVAKKILYIDNLSESGDYYQVPTLFFDNLPYAEYTVQITVGTTGGRGTYYLDGIRVYNPAGDPADNSDSQYSESEQNAKFTTLRSILLNQNSFNGSASGVEGAVFIDSKDNNNTGDGPTTEGLTDLDIADYTKDGPKNEVYLASGQSIAFKVKNTAAANYYIGLRRLGTEYPASDTPVTTDESAENESTPVVNVEYSYGETEKQSLNIQHASDLYYKAIPNDANYIVITNTSTTGEIIAVTKLRTTGLNNADLDLVVAKEAIAQVYALRSMPVFTNKPVDDIPAADEQIKPEDGNVNVDTPELNDSTDNIIAVLKGLQKLINKLFLGFGKWF